MSRTKINTFFSNNFSQNDIDPRLEGNLKITASSDGSLFVFFWFYLPVSSLVSLLLFFVIYFEVWVQFVNQ